MTTQTEALNIAIDYMNERLEDHDAKYQRHPATEAERNNILADITAIKEALAQQSNEQVEPVAYQNIDLPNEVVSLEDWEDIDWMWRMMYRPLFAHPPVPTAQPKEPEQEPVDSSDFIRRTNQDYAAWCKTYYQADALDERGMLSLHGLWAWQEQERRRTTPPQRKPLTDEEIERLIFRSGGHKSTQNLMSNPMQVREYVELWNERIYKFARAIEAAHGIKE